MDTNKIKAYYAGEVEKERLAFSLEGLRTKEIIRRYLRSESMRILDIGGGAGYYAFWLQALGHRVTLVDLSPENIRLVAEASAGNVSLEHFEVGDATRLNFADGSFDLALLLGPLYHLTRKSDRLKALSEAARVVRSGGTVLSACISRYASLFDGLKRDLIRDPAFINILNADLDTGIHQNETGNPEYFTTAYFHTPAELKMEIEESGLVVEKLIAVESLGYSIAGFKTQSADEGYLHTVLSLLEKVESNEDLLAASPHFIGVGRKG